MPTDSMWNPDRETMPPDRLRDLQDKKLRRQVSVGYYNAPVIRDLWDRHNVTPEDVQSVDDLAKVPTFRKDDSRSLQVETGDPFGGRLCVPRKEISEVGGWIGTSSGTTGVSTNVFLTDQDASVLGETYARSLWEMGVRPNDTVLVWGLPYHLNTQGVIRATKDIGAVPTQVNHSSEGVGRVAHVLDYLEPSLVWVISPPIRSAVNEYARDNDVNLRDLFDPVESIIYGGEPVIEPVRNEIEFEWGVKVFEIDGGLEPAWGPAECREHEGLHISSDHFYVETRDPETGERLPDGARGEIVVTALTYDGMSHICWGHDDIGVVDRGRCSCGRTGARIDLLGRVGDLVRVEGTDVLPIDVLRVVHGIDEMPDNLFQFFADSTESLRLRIGYCEAETAEPSALVAEIRNRLESELGVGVHIIDIVTERKLSELGPEHKVPRVTEE